MKQWHRQIIRLIVAVMIFLGCYWLSGCAATGNKPSASGAAASTHVAAAHGAIQNAQSSTARAGQLSDSIGGHLDRAERKNVLARRWLELQNGK